jgi:hypothetical protein
LLNFIRGWGLWLMLAVLGAFVIFIECMADVGGSRETQQVPSDPQPTAEATP